MTTVFIYALKDPRTEEIRYIGKTKNLRERMQKHCSNLSKEHNHRVCWIRQLQRLGLQPQVEIIDEVSIEEWPSWEVAYIEFFRSVGCNLVNCTSGGEGINNPTAEVRAKISAAKKGEKHHLFGKTHTPEAREKIRAAGKLRIGNKNSNFGKKHSPETKDKMRQARLGKRVSPEIKLRLSEIHRQRWAQLKGA